VVIIIVIVPTSGSSEVVKVHSSSSSSTSSAVPVGQYAKRSGPYSGIQNLHNPDQAQKCHTK
jgi:hypothetical protein